jgi:YegS/Rv2252/BmrU family lipid kinase
MATILEQVWLRIGQVKVEAIINASSGAGNNTGVKERLAEAFEATGVEAHIAMAHSGAEVIKLAQRAAKSDADVIVAGGGDGTISSVAASVIETDKVLGVLPFGTMNHFAKDLHIPLDLEGAVQTIAAGHEMKVDVGEVNGHIFINNSSLGLYPSIVRERDRRHRLGWGKWPAYVWAAIGVLRRYPFLNIRVSVDGQDLRSKTPFVFIGNNEYEMERLYIGRRASLDKCELSLYMTNRTGRLGLMRLALRALFGGLRQEKDFLALNTKEIWIETKHKRLRAAFDGEVAVLEPPLHYRVRPGALRVIVPVEAGVNSEGR